MVLSLWRFGLVRWVSQRRKTEGNEAKVTSLPAYIQQLSLWRTPFSFIRGYDNSTANTFVTHIPSIALAAILVSGISNIPHSFLSVQV